jgi:hypothetical protein
MLKAPSSCLNAVTRVPTGRNRYLVRDSIGARGEVVAKFRSLLEELAALSKVRESLMQVALVVQTYERADYFRLDRRHISDLLHALGVVNCLPNLHDADACVSDDIGVPDVTSIDSISSAPIRLSSCGPNCAFRVAMTL